MLKTKSWSALAVSITWIFITAFCLAYLLQTVMGLLEKNELTFPISISNAQSIILTGSILLLMVFNWGVEAVKWKLAIRDLEGISFFKAVKATLAGVAVSTWMPNRIGEYIGKVFYVQPQNRTKGAISALFVSYTQIVATLIFGLIGGVYFLMAYGEVHVYGLLMLLITLVLGVSVFGYRLLRREKLAYKRGKFWKAIRYFLLTFTRYNSSMHLRMIVLSALRFAIFSTQFVLALHLFGVQSSWVELFLLVAAIYGIQTVLPTPAIAALGIRGSLSLYFLGFVTDLNGAILSASYGIWLVNLLLPSFFGFICLLTSPTSFEVKSLVAKLPVKVFSR